MSVGFEVIREFEYFVVSIKDIDFRNKNNLHGLLIQEIETPPLNMINEFWDFAPSWQNSHLSIQRTPEQFKIYGTFINNEMIGYIVYEIKSGDITQLVVDKSFRRKGIGTELLYKVTTIVSGESIKLIYVNCQFDAAPHLLKSMGIAVLGK